LNDQSLGWNTSGDRLRHRRNLGRTLPRDASGNIDTGQHFI
jgi:hypothetical protein